jgi:hypothetical protein
MISALVLLAQLTFSHLQMMYAYQISHSKAEVDTKKKRIRHPTEKGARTRPKRVKKQAPTTTYTTFSTSSTATATTTTTTTTSTTTTSTTITDDEAESDDEERKQEGRNAEDEQIVSDDEERNQEGRNAEDEELPVHEDENPEEEKKSSSSLQSSSLQPLHSMQSSISPLLHSNISNDAWSQSTSQLAMEGFSQLT